MAGIEPIIDQTSADCVRIRLTPESRNASEETVIVSKPIGSNHVTISFDKPCNSEGGGGRSGLNHVTIRVASEAPSSSDEDTESQHSVQGKETASPHDTSDTSDSDVSAATWHFEITGRSRELEYDVVDMDDQPQYPISSSEDSDEIEEIAQLGAVAAAVTRDLDGGSEADTSSTCSTSPTSNSDIDPGLPRADYHDFWKCAQCKETNDNRNYQLCHKCYAMRKNFFPQHEKRKRRRPRRDRDELAAKRPRQETDTQESGVDLGSGSQGSTAAEENTGDQVDGAGVQSCDSKLCSMCYSNPKNGAFVHGKTIHANFCCYKCALKTWKSIACCPLCRKKVQQVYKLLNDSET